MTTLYKPRPKRWPQVSLRSLFVLVTVVGCALGWLGVQGKWIGQRHDFIRSTDRNRHSFMLMPGALAPWSIRILGERGYEAGLIAVPDEDHPSDEDEEFAAKMESLFPEAIIGYRSFQSELDEPFKPRLKHR